jgi:hypothetical protein
MTASGRTWRSRPQAPRNPNRLRRAISRLSGRKWPTPSWIFPLFRLLLLTREKLRFIEHTLPPYVPPSKKRKKEAAQPQQNTTDADYEILAELRGHAEDDYYKIQVEFVDAHTNEVLFNELYRIRPESADQPPPDQVPDNQALPPDATGQPAQAPVPMPAPATSGNGTL